MPPVRVYFLRTCLLSQGILFCHFSFTVFSGNAMCSLGVYIQPQDFLILFYVLSGSGGLGQHNRGT